MTVTSPEEAIALARRRYTDPQLVTAALSLPWMFEPGSGFSYSNTNYVVVGMMLAETGTPGGEAAPEPGVPVPGMWHSGLATRAGIRGPHLHEYVFLGQTVQTYDLRGFHPLVASSAGAVVATAWT